jgi:hypothetical protein
VADHPWTKVTRDSAAVRIAMTVAQAGKHEGLLLEVTSEQGVETDSPVILFAERPGKVNSDLTVGVDVTSVVELVGNSGLAHKGMQLNGQGFLVDENIKRLWTERSRKNLDTIIKPYMNGRDLAQRNQDRFAIDLYPMTSDELRSTFPDIYQHLLLLVKPERDGNADPWRRDN